MWNCFFEKKEVPLEESNSKKPGLRECMRVLATVRSRGKTREAETSPEGPTRTGVTPVPSRELESEQTFTVQPLMLLQLWKVRLYYLFKT